MSAISANNTTSAPSATATAADAPAGTEGVATAAVLDEAWEPSEAMVQDLFKFQLNTICPPSYALNYSLYHLEANPDVWSHSFKKNLSAVTTRTRGNHTIPLSRDVLSQTTRLEAVNQAVQDTMIDLSREWRSSPASSKIRDSGEGLQKYIRAPRGENSSAVISNDDRWPSLIEHYFNETSLCAMTGCRIVEVEPDTASDGSKEAREELEELPRAIHAENHGTCQSGSRPFLFF